MAEVKKSLKKLECLEKEVVRALTAAHVGRKGVEGALEKALKHVDATRECLVKMQGSKKQSGGFFEMLNADVMNTSELLQRRDVYNMGNDQATAMKYTNTSPFTSGTAGSDGAITPAGSDGSLVPPTYIATTSTGGGKRKGVKAKSAKKSK